MQEKFTLEDTADPLGALEELLKARRWRFLPEKYAQELALLVNDGLVVAGELFSPLKALHLLAGAVIGPNGDSKSMLHGNYHGSASRPVSILNGIKQLAGTNIAVTFALGSPITTNKATAAWSGQDNTTTPSIPELYRTYRYFSGKLLYAFGHGLSYTKFDYTGGKLNSNKIAPNGTVNVTFTIKNTGKRDGDDVAPVNYRHVNSSVPQPKLALCGFSRVPLKRGDSKKITIEVPAERLRYWHAQKKIYAVEPGDYEILIGSASDDIRLKLPMTITAQ